MMGMPYPKVETMPTTQPVKAVLDVRQFEAFRKLIYDTTGISLAEHKRSLVQSRLQKRLRHHDLNSYAAYYSLVTKGDPSGTELQEMVNRVTTNKTNFFRENHHFDYLREVVFPRLVSLADKGQRKKSVRIWCAASSTGEEPYSLAMTTKDYFAGKPGWDLDIIATDIDTDVLKKAENAIFAGHTDDEVPDDLLRKHFIRGSGGSDGKWIVRPETAQLVNFQRLNLLDERWPINGDFDAIFCRNVLIYFDKDTIDTVMRRMAKHLKPDGSLFIGHSESLYRISDTYKRVGKTVYQHVNAGEDTAMPAKGTPAAKPGFGSGGGVRPPAAKPRVQRKVQNKSIIIGDVVASKTPLVIKTILGSCIAVCLYDRKAKIGGMNHFALPKGSSCSRAAASFGVHAMELLINEIMQLGGDRRQMVAKVFGGAQVLGSSGRCVGEQNIQFVRDFLRTERLPIIGECLGGECGLKVLFEAHSGKARVKRLDQQAVVSANSKLTTAPEKEEVPTSDITLF